MESNALRPEHRAQIEAESRLLLWPHEVFALARAMTIIGQPEPLQPTDTQDRPTRISIDTRYSPVGFVDRVEFKCAKCHRTYWRDVLLEEQYDEVVYYDGLGPYTLNPTSRAVYAPYTHECGDSPSI